MMRRMLAVVAAVVMGAAVGTLALPATQAPAAVWDKPPDTYYNSRCGNVSRGVLLTFDDWAVGDPYRATRVGSYLRSRNIRAAFFLINQYAKNYPDIVWTLRQQGHWVLNHTYSHANLTTLSSAGVRWQIRSGVAGNRLRPPVGAYDSRVSSIAGSLGYRICTWTINTRDWMRPDGIRYRSPSSIRAIVRTSPSWAKVGGVILGHLYTNYPSAVGGIIDDLQAQGLAFCRNRGAVGASMPFPLPCT